MRKRKQRPADSDVLLMEAAKRALPVLLQHPPGQNIAGLVQGLLIDISEPADDGVRVFVVRTAMQSRREIGHLTSDGQIIYTSSPPRSD
ncbi:MAG: hypothetical protein HZB75_01115 [Candidatus Saccharibacteria bacterium]|jgi:hypothetical protein|nr:MAG: hypothetical protein HZB75_01115 [Candidatus Saccharibacteria bacterium]